MNRSITGDTARRRSAPLLWGSGALAATVLVLAVNGTLSSWTTAVINNDNNTADSASSVVLEESGPDSTGTATTCTTAGSATNTDTCSTINKYGDGGVTATGVSALQPGDSLTTTVSLTNTGSGDASAFTLTPAACSSVYYTGINTGSAPAGADDLCNRLQVAVTCTGDATLTVASQSLAAFATAGAQTLVSGLVSGDSTSCAFTVSLPSTTPANYSGQTVSQDLEWKIVV